MKSLEELMNLRDMRSADRANIKRMYQQVKRGEPLSYQQQRNLDAYIARYSVTGMPTA